MRTNGFLLVLVFALALEVSAQNEAAKSPETVVRAPEADVVIRSWPAKPREVAVLMIGKYGQPDEATASMLIWHHHRLDGPYPNNRGRESPAGEVSIPERELQRPQTLPDTSGNNSMRSSPTNQQRTPAQAPHTAAPANSKNVPWKYTIVYREEVPHQFPRPHTDLLEQGIDYRTPADKFDELARFDGSIIAERTKGELAARCDREEMNFLALNLANDICMGKLTVEKARQTYAEAAAAFMKNELRPYVQGLKFYAQGTNGGTADPDKPAGSPVTTEKTIEKPPAQKEEKPRLLE